MRTKILNAGNPRASAYTRLPADVACNLSVAPSAGEGSNCSLSLQAIVSSQQGSLTCRVLTRRSHPWLAPPVLSWLLLLDSPASWVPFLLWKSQSSAFRLYRPSSNTCLASLRFQGIRVKLSKGVPLRARWVPHLSPAGFGKQQPTNSLSFSLSPSLFPSISTLISTL